MGGNVSLIDGHIDKVKQTNYDRIRNMSVEEMAESLALRIMCGCCPCTQLCNKNKNVSCVDTFKIWLEAEVTE